MVCGFAFFFPLWNAGGRRKMVTFLSAPECAGRLLLMVALGMQARARTEFTSGLVNISPFQVDTSALYSAEENAKYFPAWCRGDSEPS